MPITHHVVPVQEVDHRHHIEVQFVFERIVGWQKSLHIRHMDRLGLENLPRERVQEERDQQTEIFGRLDRFGK